MARARRGHDLTARRVGEGPVQFSPGYVREAHVCSVCSSTSTAPLFSIHRVALSTPRMLLAAAVMRVDMTKKLCLNAPLAHARNIANNSQKVGSRRAQVNRQWTGAAFQSLTISHVTPRRSA